MLQQLNFISIFKWRGKILLGCVLFTSLDGRFKPLIPVQSCFLAVWCVVLGEALQARTAVAAARKPA